MAANPAEKIPLTITPVEVTESGSFTLKDAAAFKVLLNPSEFNHRRSISYNTEETPGQPGADTRFAAVNPDTVGFSLMLDGTGVVPNERPLTVEEQVKKLSKVVCNYDGKKHEPNHVRLLWGTLILYGRLTEMNLTYTLFKPSGDPLRAKADLKFVGFMSNKQTEAAARRSSPDLSHVVEVRAGDTLPLLCSQIYGDPAYYAEVARFNRLQDVHRLTPGDRLRFPPLA